MFLLQVSLFQGMSFKRVPLYLSLPYVATKSRLERELAEAVREEGDTPPETPSAGVEEDIVGSDSDSEGGDEGTVAGVPAGAGHSNSIEASLWSLDMMTSSTMETSVYETEVRKNLNRGRMPRVGSQKV